MLREHFYGIPRPIQIQALQQIEEALSNGYRNIIISAPTGVGKSYIAVALALAFKEADILTATVQLQEQYLRDFKFIRPLMGRKNFTCPIYEKPCSMVPTIRCRGMKKTIAGNSSVEDEDDNVDNNNISNNPLLSIEVVPKCERYLTKDDLQRIYVLNKGTSNERVTIISNFNNNGHSLCEYYLQKHLAYRSSFRIINYHEYFTLLNNVASKDKLSTKLLICDEAHMLEEKVIDFYNVIIDDKLLNPLRKFKLIDKNLTVVEYIPEDTNKEYYQQLLAIIIKVIPT